MQNKTDLQKAFQFARGFYTYEGGPRRHAPETAAKALRSARKLIEALPAYEAAVKATQAALATQQAIDGRQYAKGMPEATAAAQKAIRARIAAQRFKVSRPVWAKGDSGTWQNEKPGEFYTEEPESVFRNVAPAHEIAELKHTGYYSDNFQSGLCVGIVVQLPSRNGKARFAAGYKFTEYSDGATVNLARIFESDFILERELARRQISKPYWTPDMESAGYWAEEAHKTARRGAAYAADSMAEKAAELEREYQAASSAGGAWAELKAEEAATRAEALAILAERRKARALDSAGFPALCAALRSSVAGLVRDIQKSRERRAELASGDGGESTGFYTGDARLREAFCDGAGLAVFPE